jgi:uncharacterized membrane protein HdeD (DUF308 family)
MKDPLLQSVKEEVKYWWISLLIGLLTVILGIWSLTTPDTTLVALTYIFISVFLITGIIDIFFAVSNKNTLSDWQWRLAIGTMDILFAILLIALPTPIVTVGLIYFVGFWILFRSIWTVVESYDLQKKGVQGWNWLLVLGILSILFSFFFLFSPVIFQGAFIVALVGAALIVYGIFRIYIAFKMKSIQKDIKETEKY